MREIIPFTVETSSIEIELLKKKKKDELSMVELGFILPSGHFCSAREIMTLKIV